MSQTTHTDPAQKANHAARNLFLAVAGGIVVLIIIGSASDGQGKPDASATAAPSAYAAPASDPSDATLTPAAPAVAEAAETTTTPPALTAGQARAQARTLLAGNVQHYRDLLSRGMALAAQQDSEFVTWRVSTRPESDLTFMDAFGQADAGFTAETEPPSISTWRDDMGDMTGDLGRWVTAAVAWRGGFSDDATYRKSVAKVRADLDRADADVALVAAGK